MNIQSCETCGILFDKEVLLEILRKNNLKKSKETNTYSREYNLECPICKKGPEFNFYDEEV